MKNLKSKSIRVADLDVTIETILKRQYDSSTTVTVAGTCGKSSYVGTMIIPPNPKATQEQVEKDIDDFCESIARETAGREKVRRLAEKLT